MMFLKLSLLTLLIAVPSLHVSGENVITCNGNVQRLVCESGVISTTTVLYGRRTQSICNTNKTPAELANTTCSIDITNTIANRCNWLKECEYKTDSLGIVEPCPGIYKYINTTYSCISARTNAICENSYGTLNCANGNISIRQAFYGRSTSKICSSGLNSSLINNTNCIFNAYDNVKNLCNGKAECTLFSSSHNFSDVCNDTRKYLSVTYVCAITAPKTTLACEGSNAILTCANHTIKVLTSNYGRTDSGTCSAGMTFSQISNTNCYKTDSLVRVSASCNGKNNCVVPATNQFFNEPCSGTSKYLEIGYSCI